MGVRGGWREAVGDGSPERLGRFPGGTGGYGGRGGGGSRRAVGRDRRGRGGAILARAGDPLGLPERHVVR